MREWRAVPLALFFAVMTDELCRSFGPAALRTLVWGRSFERGQGYVVDGRVKRLKVGDAEAGGVVRGTETYRVRLWLEGGGPRFSCTCPVAADGLFCKHCVAALSSRSIMCARGSAPTTPRAQRRTPPFTTH